MNLNPLQKKAASFKGKNLLLISSAGSGKSTVLGARTAWLAKHTEDEILLLTFTVKAAEEMLERVKETVPEDYLTQITSGTFHSFAYTMMKKYHKYLGYSSPLNVIDTRDQKELLSSIAREKGCTVSVKSILSANSYAINTMTPFADVIKDNLKGITPASIETCETVLKEFSKTKKKYNLLDFDDLLFCLYQLLGIKEAKKRIATYKHILLDEVQDNNNLQIQIIKRLITNKTHVFAVGDEAQSIYQFRGANRSFILEFPEQFDADCMMLTENYRSTQQILDLANCVASSFVDGFRAKMTSHLVGEKPRYIHFYDENEQVKRIVKEVKKIKGNLGDIAVIYRASSSADKLEMALRAERIPYARRGTGSLFELAVIKDILLFLRAVTSKTDTIAWRSVLLSVPGVGPALAGKIFSAVQEKGTDSLLEFKDKKTEKGLKRLHNYMTKATKIKPKKAVDYATEYWEEYLSKRTTKTKDEVDGFYGRLREIAKKYKSTRGFLIDMALDTSKDIDPDKGKLVLSTIHSVKGMGFERIYLLNAVEGKLPSTYFLPDEGEPGYFEQLEEEKRLFYVAITRARKYLTICAPFNEEERLSWDKYGNLSEAETSSKSRFMDVKGIEKTYLEIWPEAKRQKAKTKLSMLHRLRMMEIED